MRAIVDTKDARICLELVNIDSDNWIQNLASFDIVVWRPYSMGIEAASYFKEKIYFIQFHLGKLVIPNFQTVWHFESKVAQTYLFQLHGIKTPKTVVTFSRDAALNLLSRTRFPVVEKRSAGAGSSNVRLLKSLKMARRSADATFFRSAWMEGMRERGRLLGRFSLNYIRTNWAQLFKLPNQPVMYWQEFVPLNDRDLRITVIGDRFAFGFWRNNRKNDFRASGSGSIDYERPIPHDVIRYCLQISKKLNFDSMAYDVIFDGDDCRIVEMSYGYLESAVYASSGYFELVADELKFRQGHTWPQKLWAEWMSVRVFAESQPR